MILPTCAALFCNSHRILQGSHGIHRALLFCREPAALIELLMGSQGPLLSYVAGHAAKPRQHIAIVEGKKRIQALWSILQEHLLAALRLILGIVQKHPHNAI